MTNRFADAPAGRMELPALETLLLPRGSANVEWRRHARARRISLRIDPRCGRVVVTLPPRTGRNAGVALLMTHADWVAERLAALPEHLSIHDGAVVPIRGVAHRICHVPRQRGAAWVSDRNLFVTGAPEFLCRRVIDFLRAEARSRLSALVSAKAAPLGLQPRRVIVKDTQTRWGSCAPDGSVAFSWRLIMAPDFVQDYVAAHEVAHLKHMNHGKRFWALVNRLTPHRDAAIPWLRHEGARLLRIG